MFFSSPSSLHSCLLYPRGDGGSYYDDVGNIVHAGGHGGYVKLSNVPIAQTTCVTNFPMFGFDFLGAECPFNCPNAPTPNSVCTPFVIPQQLKLLVFVAAAGVSISI